MLGKTYIHSALILIVRPLNENRCFVGDARNFRYTALFNLCLRFDASKWEKYLCVFFIVSIVVSSLKGLSRRFCHSYVSAVKRVFDDILVGSAGSAVTDLVMPKRIRELVSTRKKYDRAFRGNTIRSSMRQTVIALDASSISCFLKNRFWWWLSAARQSLPCKQSLIYTEVFI